MLSIFVEDLCIGFKKLASPRVNVRFYHARQYSIMPHDWSTNWIIHLQMPRNSIEKNDKRSYK